MSDEATLNRRTIVLALGTFAVITSNYVYFGVLSDLAGDLGVSVGLAGQLVTVFGLTNVLGSPLLVPATGGIERRRLLTLAMLVYAAANLAVLVLPSFGWLVAARIVAGASAAVFTPVAAAVATQFVPEGRAGSALAIVNSGLASAFVAGIPLGTAIGGAFDWRLAFAFAGCLTLAALVIVRVTLPEVPPMPRSATGGSRLTVLRRPGVALNIGFTTLGFATYFVVLSYSGPVLEDLTGFESGGISVLQAGFGAAGVIGVIAVGVIADRHDTWILLVGVFVAVSVALLPFSLFAGAGGGAAAISAAALGMALLGLGGFALIPLQQYRLVQCAPDVRHIVLALNAAAMFAGQAIGSAIGGLTVEYISLGSLGWVGAAMGAAGVVMLFATRPAAQPEPAAQATPTTGA